MRRFGLNFFLTWSLVLLFGCDGGGAGSDDGGGTIGPDGGSPDAGGRDDGGSPDAGGRDDGGSPDAGGRDDGGSPDAGVRDDGGSPDAGDPDDGGPDASGDAGPPPSCDDAMRNGDETDTDCGGGTCPTCAVGQSCNDGADCAEGACDEGTCVMPTCMDEVHNGTESDEDCGGSECLPCTEGLTCAADTDCASGVCDDMAGTCSAATCDDEVHNQDETDVDCGGATCDPCADDLACSFHADCTEGLCIGGVCASRGLGTDGVLDVDSDTVINTTRGNVSASAGGTTAMLTGDSGTFSAGDLVLLHLSQTSGASPGVYELAVIASAVPGQLQFTEPLANDYVTSSTSVAQVVLVPQYTDVTVADGFTLSAPEWDGLTGGILVFLASGTVTVNGVVTMEGAGFRGAGHGCAGGTSFQCDLAADDSYQGESYAGEGVENTANNLSGGGGGAEGQDCVMGAGGGHWTAGRDGDNSSCGSCPASNCGTGGAGGAVSPDDGAHSLLFGSAGGEGGADEDGAYPGAGGDGGGLILVYAETITVGSTGRIDADGEPGAPGSQGDPACIPAAGSGMGGGGGGAGGAIWLDATGAVALGDARVSAVGGAGANCGDRTGGSGGEGILAAFSPSTSGTTSPALVGPLHCISRTLDGDETDVDCGGSCRGCSSGQACVVDADCRSSTCDAESMTCAASVDEEFEDGPPLRDWWTVAGNANWLVSTSPPITGTYSAQSGNIGNGQSSRLRSSITCSADTSITFDFEVSTEVGFDFLRFRVDGAQRRSWSGSTSGSATEPLGAGAHTLEWAYTKDGSVSTGADTVWIDNIHAPDCTFDVP